MESLDANYETVNSSTSNQPDSAETSHSPSVHYETVARYQQYESIVDTGCEQPTTQYEAVHNNTLEPVAIGEAATQGNQLAACVDSYERLRPVANNDADVHVLPTANINRIDATAANSDFFNRLHPLFTAQDHDDIPPHNPLYTAQDDTPPNPLYTAQDDTPPNLLYTAQDDTPPNPLYTAQDDTPPNPLYTAQDDTPPNPLYTAQDDTPPNPLYTAQDDTPPNPLYTAQDDTPPNPLYTAQDDTPPNPLYTAQDDTPPNSLRIVQNHENRPPLPTPRNNNQPTSDTTFFNLKLPPQLQPLR
jgi:hypothetical protein